MSLNSYRCCKPFSEGRCTKKLKDLSMHYQEQLNNLYDTNKYNSAKKICSSCYIKLCTQQNFKTKENIYDQDLNETELDRITLTPDITKMQRQELLKNLNTNVIPHLINDISPIRKKHCIRPNYVKRKSNEISASIQQTLEKTPNIEQPDQDKLEKKSHYYDEIIKNLQFQFENGDILEKRKILTLLPKEMSYEEIRNIFGNDLTSHTIFKSKEAQKNMCSFSNISPPNYKRHVLSDEIKNLVNDFYTDDDISRIMPGSQNYIIVREGDNKKQHQKRLMLSTLKEAYLEFKNRNPSKKIGFDKFITLKPKFCMKLGVGNQQNVCVCMLHQNMKLMFEKSQLKGVTFINRTINTYKDVVKYVMCEGDSKNCFLSLCDVCIENLRMLEYQIERNFQNSGTVEIKYKKWCSVDRCNLETLVDSPKDFIDRFIKHLKILIPHHFISHQQSKFFTEKKLSLETGEILVQLDFAENYSFIIQDAVQGYHWTNNQCTIHPFVIYYNFEGSLSHLSYVVISNCNTHDSVAVHLFIEKMISFVKKTLGIDIKKIFFVSDGAGSQYKNKYNFTNLCHFQIDFGMEAEWHFHATSHGKSACDGVGGTLKRAAHRYSLANKNQIQTALELYEWASNIFESSISFEYATDSEYTETKTKLQVRYRNALTIAGTQMYHSFVPQNLNYMKVRRFSNCEDYDLKKVWKN